MVELYSSLQAREHRFRVPSDRQVELFLQPRSQAEDEAIQIVPIENGEQDAARSTGYLAHLIDLSCGGAKLRLPQAVDLEEEVWLRIRQITPGVDLVVSGRISWTTAEDDGSWLLGCEISPRFPEDFVEGLAEAGMVERRDNGRIPVNLAVGAKSDTSPQWRGAELVDYSSGGFCVTLPNYDGKSQRLLLAVHHPDGREFMIPATIQWVANKQGRLLAGCEFIRRDGFDILNKVIRAEHSEEAAPEMEETPEAEAESAGLGRWTWLLIGSGLVAAGLAWWLGGALGIGGPMLVGR